MRGSLRAQVLFAPALVVIGTAVLVAIELHGREGLTTRLTAIGGLRQALERSVGRLEDRHQRTVRRVREALLDPRAANQVAILAWTAEHYAAEMDRNLGEALATLHGAPRGTLSLRVVTDLAHLERQYERVAEVVSQLTPTLERLLIAAEAGDPDELTAAQQEVDRQDRTMVSVLQIARRMVSRLCERQEADALTGRRAVPTGVWFLALCAAAAAFAYAASRLDRLGRLARGESVAPASGEEAQLAAQLTQGATRTAELERQLAERTREAEKTQVGLRSAEQELALLRIYNDNLMSSLRSAIVVTDARGAISAVNRTARRLLGLDAAWIGRPLAEHPLVGAIERRHGDAQSELTRTLSDGAVVRFDAVPFSRDGQEILVDLLLAPSLDESGQARGVIWVADDVTEATRTKKQLLAAERLAAVGSLSAQVAHEIRNPLSAIGLNAELLEEDFSASLTGERRAEATGLLRAIGAEIERLTEITEGYLQLTRLPQPELRQTDVNQVITDLFAMLEEELRTHQITVHLELAAPAPVALCDPGQLRQALLNIVRNSREAMDGGGRLHVRTLASPAGVTLSVQDDGPGIPDHLINRIFEPFFTTKPKGTGLGLSLTQQIIAEHGGTVRVESAQGLGTKMEIDLPHRVNALTPEP